MPSPALSQAIVSPRLFSDSSITDKSMADLLAPAPI
jgi:hypothetical protein